MKQIYVLYQTSETEGEVKNVKLVKAAPVIHY